MKTSFRPHTGPTDWLRRFFFAEEVPYGLALVRILLPLVLLWDMSQRWSFARELYSADGAPAPLWITYGMPSPLPEFSGAVVVALFTLMLTALLTASLGWMTRVSLFVSAVLYWYFTTMDAISTITKYTVVANHVLLLLALSPCGKIWSIDAARRPVIGPRFAIWPQRLMQLLVAIVYLGAAMTKIHTPEYFNGDQLVWWMFTHVNGEHALGEFLGHYPAVLIIGAYAAIIWEVLFIVMCWKGLQKISMLFVGAMFHVGTYLTLGLDVFPLVMISIYFAFLNEREVLRAMSWLGALRVRVRLPAINMRPIAAGFAPKPHQLGPVAFGLFAWCVALGGASIEQAMDPYQLRGPDGPLPLKSLDHDAAKQMLSDNKAIRLQDIVYSLEMGTDLFGQALIGRKTTFRHGETLIAQCRTAPPHPDMYVECNLHAETGGIIERRGFVLSREANRLNFHFELGEKLPPGNYVLALNFSGTEVASRVFRVEASGNRASEPSNETSHTVSNDPPALLESLN